MHGDWPAAAESTTFFATKAGRMASIAEPIEKALHPVDLMGDGPTEVLDELLVAPAAWEELRKRLDRNERVLDLVGDTRREHLEIGEPLGAPPLHLERLVRRQIAEDGDGTQHPACLIVKG